MSLPRLVPDEVRASTNDAAALPEPLPLRLGRQIGSGAFSTVHVARGYPLERVIKVLRRSTWEAFAEKRLSTMPFDSEILCLTQCQHPNIVRLLSSATTETTSYLELEYVPKGDLCDCLIQDGPYNDTDARDLASEILTAVLHIQAHDVIHRDIKPEKYFAYW